MIFGLKLFGGRTDCDETYSYNDTCAMHLAEYPEELRCYVCPRPRTAKTEVVTHYNFKAYRKKENVMDKVKGISKREVVVSADNGNTIKLIFKEDDDLDTEESIIMILLKSYEERMKKINNNEK